jgi:hypothetical protein
VKNLCLLIAILLLCATLSLAQGQSASVQGNSKAVADGKALHLESGMQLVAQLQNSLDAGKVKEGDRVILKTTKPIQANGEVIIKKGATLIGHVTQAQKKSKEHNQSSLTLLFDRLETGSLSLPINATIISVTQAARLAQVDDTMFGASSSAGSSSSVSRRSQNSGGLLGGATNTVGGVVNTTTQTVGGASQTLGGVVNSTTDAAGIATGAVGGSLKGLQILNATDAKAEGSSTLSLTGGNLRLEKGASFNLLLNNDPKAESKAAAKEPKPGKRVNPIP